ncbi:MAG: efflux RND transporter periplasmic adaptor subunit [Alphaproteobacteria bacterium]|nr:efflux RND transporter periplasmic adaptor subunit [Alphaproteobacteria bacterium]
MKTYQKVIIALVLCSVGVAGILWLKKGKEIAPVVHTREAIPVEAVAAKTGTMLRRVSAVGKLSPIQSVILHPEVQGKIAKIYFKEGQKVKEGSPLFKIDDAVYKAKVMGAEAALAQAKEEHSRAVKLLEKNFGTVAQRDKTLADMQVKEAELALAKIDLENTIIKAPFSGVIGLSEVSVGAAISPSNELATVVDLDPINVDFSIPESFFPHIKEGDIVDVTVEDIDILPVEATIKAISPEISADTLQVVIRAEMPNKELIYRPGFFARVLVLAGTIENAVLVPTTAIEREGEEEYVLLVVDNVSVKTVVSTGMQEGNEIEITHGVKPGDLVITAGGFRAQDGTEVTVVNKPQEQAQEKHTQRISRIQVGAQAANQRSVFLYVAEGETRRAMPLKLESRRV